MTAGIRLRIRGEAATVSLREVNLWERIHSRMRWLDQQRWIDCTGLFANEFAPTGNTFPIQIQCTR
jgi:hypothetical protein